MTKKVSVQELNEINNESYSKWFERWYKKRDLPKELRITAMKGYSGCSIKVNDYDNYTQRRMWDSRFIKMLQEELEGVHIYKKESEPYKIKVFGKELTRWTDPKICMNWSESE